MNVLILFGGSQSNDNSNYPSFLNEFKNKPVLEYVLETCKTLGPSSINLVFKKHHIRKYFLKELVEQIHPSSMVIGMEGDTQGAACSAMLAVDQIDNKYPLLVLNGDEHLSLNFAEIIDGFVKRNADAGTIVFDSVHPRYSYVRLDAEDNVIEAAEKKPISRNATVGFYWFNKGSDFVLATKKMIIKNDRYNGLFYVCPSFNQLILEGKKVVVHKTDSAAYHPLKDSNQIYENSCYLSK